MYMGTSTIQSEWSLVSKLKPQDYFPSEVGNFLVQSIHFYSSIHPATCATNTAGLFTWGKQSIL